MVMPAWLIFDPFFIRPGNWCPFCQGDVCCPKQSHNSIFLNYRFSKIQPKIFFSGHHKEAFPQNFPSLFPLGCRKTFFGEPVFSVKQKKGKDVKERLSQSE